MKKEKTMVKVLAAALAAPLILSGCSEKTTKSDSNTTDDSKKPITFDFFYDASWVPTDGWTGIIPQAITEKTGVTLKVTKAADGNQLPLLIASGDLPELVYTGSSPGDKLSNSKYCYSYDELIAKYDPTFKPNQAYIDVAKSFSSDDKYYTILNYFSLESEWKDSAIGCPGQAAIYYRDDLLKAIGNPKINSVDDFVNVLGMIKEKYPDMVPMTMSAPSWYLQPFKTWLGIQPVLDDGSYVYETSSPNYLKFLKFANNLVRKGYISADNYAATSETDARQLANNGKSFAIVHYTGVNNNEYYNTATKKVDPNAKWLPLAPLTDSNGKLYPSVRTPKGWLGTFVTKNCKDPGRAINFIDFMFSEEGRALSMWGRQGIDYTLDSKGVPQFSDDWKTTAKDSTAMAKKYNPWFYLGITEVDEGYSYYSGGPQEQLDAFNKIKNNTVNNTAIAIATPTSTSQEGIIKSKLDAEKKADEAKVIFSKSDDEFTKNYNDYMNAMKKIGVDTYNSYMTKKIEEINSKYNFK